MTGRKGRSGPNKGKGKAYAWIVAHVSYAGDDCLPWPFSGTRGRGHLRYMGASWYASRLMCQLAHGEPPSPDHEAAHSCGRGHEGCVSPRHLSWKTRAENRQDCAMHGTNYRGARNASAGKLTYDQAVEVRTLKGAETADVVAARYGVSPTAIYLIWKGQTYKSAAQARVPAWSPEEYERLLEATRRGMSSDEAAAYVGRPAASLWKYRRKLQARA